ncbi:phage terminase large subunit [Citrobacter koseri]|uniref:Phage terminase large subunit n=1 Tax=Citrobacter koseri TaxID=545 RepID=A0A3S5DPA5_CITKO|nr:phage terminase large subunit [Citrobacter koseri]
MKSVMLMQKGGEGNPLKLAEQRTKAFSTPLIMICSTPLDENDLITQQYEQSNKQKFYVPCPHCEHSHELVFESVKFDWKVIDGGRRRIPDAETAKLLCPKCSNEISEAQRVRMIKKGHWIITNPEVTDIMGYHISRLYSPINSIRSIVQDFAEAHYTSILPAFTITYLDFLISIKRILITIWYYLKIYVIHQLILIIFLMMYWVSYLVWISN